MDRKMSKEWNWKAAKAVLSGIDICQTIWFNENHNECDIEAVR